MNEEQNYIANQLINLCPIGTGKAGQFKLKLHSDLGETNWLNITTQQLHQIEGILCGEEK